MSTSIKKILHIDLDNTIFNFSKAYRESLEKNPNQPYPQSQCGFFLNLEPIDFSLYAYHELKKRFEIYFLTSPSVKNPMSYTEKRLSIEKWFGLDACYNLMIVEDKSMVKGDFLIDDNKFSNNQDKFDGTFIHFGSEEFSNWLKVLEFFKTV